MKGKIISTTVAVFRDERVNTVVVFHISSVDVLWTLHTHCQFSVSAVWMYFGLCILTVSFLYQQCGCTLDFAYSLSVFHISSVDIFWTLHTHCQFSTSAVWMYFGLCILTVSFPHQQCGRTLDFAYSLSLFSTSVVWMYFELCILTVVIFHISNVVVLWTLHTHCSCFPHQWYGPTLNFAYSL